MLLAARRECTSLLTDGAFVDTDQHHANVRSDQVCWIYDDSRSSKQQAGLVAVLRALRSMAFDLEAGHEAPGWCGFQSAPRPADLGVPRQGQLARYAVASRAVASADTDLVSHAASAQVVSATGGARYTAHRDGLPFRSASLVMWLINPDVCMRECTAIVYLTSPNPWPDEMQGYRVVKDKADLRPGAASSSVPKDDLLLLRFLPPTCLPALPTSCFLLPTPCVLLPTSYFLLPTRCPRPLPRRGNDGHERRVGFAHDRGLACRRASSSLRQPGPTTSYFLLPTS